MAAGVEGILLKEIITLLLINLLWLPSTLRIKPTHTALDCAGDGCGGVDDDSKDPGEQSANSPAAYYFDKYQENPVPQFYL